MRTPFGKSRKVDNPYAVYTQNSTGFEWRVLKTYQHPDRELENDYARWFVACKSPYTSGSWEYGDSYCQDILDYGTLQESTDEWRELYRGL